MLAEKDKKIAELEAKMNSSGEVGITFISILLLTNLYVPNMPRESLSRLNIGVSVSIIFFTNFLKFDTPANRF